MKSAPADKIKPEGMPQIKKSQKNPIRRCLALQFDLRLCTFALNGDIGCELCHGPKKAVFHATMDREAITRFAINSDNSRLVEPIDDLLTYGLRIKCAIRLDDFFEFERSHC